jgi:nitroreductase
MSNPVLTAIADRRSIRQYQPRQITEAELDILLTAAQQAPSARNSQPWYFTVVQDASIVAEVNSEANAILSRKDDIFFGAPTVIFVAAERDNSWARLDSGIATQTIALAAQSIGLGTVILGLPAAAFTGPRGKYFAELVKIPQTHDFAVAIAIGYPNGTKEAHPVKDRRIGYIR